MRPEIGDHAQTLFVGEVQHARDQARVGGVVRTADEQVGDAVAGGGELGRVGVLGLGFEDLRTRHGRPAEAARCARSWGHGSPRMVTSRQRPAVYSGGSAAASGPAVSSICHGRAPPAASTSPRRTRPTTSSGGSQARPRTSWGAEEVLGRQVVLLGQLRDGLAAAAEPGRRPRGILSAQARGGGGPSRRGRSCRQLGVGHREPPLDGVVPLARGIGAGRGCA